MPHLCVNVALGDRSYPIHIGEHLLADPAAQILPYLASRRAFVISDSTVAPLYAPTLTAALQDAGVTVELITFPAGESSKSFAQLEALLESILARAPDRKTTLIALGGGVVGDLVGFAASILLRGVPFLQIPTSLLAQVDSSVGGKTAINSASGKNLIGSFYQPRCVLADTATLRTLPLRQRQAGYAEIIKYGLIMDPDFYRWCLCHGAAILAGDGDATRHAVAMSCTHKATIVASDEQESGARALLNFGHSFAHALEAETGYGDRLLHGEAVGIGMVMACRLSQKMGWMDGALENELTAHFRALGMMATPTDLEGQSWEVARLVDHFFHDKKSENGRLTFITLRGLGLGHVARDVPVALAQEVVTAFVSSC